MKLKLIILNLIVFFGGVILCLNKSKKIEIPVIHKQETGFSSIPAPSSPASFTINNPKPDYMNYGATVEQLKKWNAEAPALTSFGVYGKSSGGKDCVYLRVKGANPVKKVMITACIHGNEPLSSSTVMWYLGTLLSSYGRDTGITAIIDSRDIYFVPIVSPDSYPSSRHVDGVDPNRDFNARASAPVRAIQELFNAIRPDAVISGHTWGRVYLTPYGKSMQNCPDHQAIMEVMDKVKEQSGYRCIRACDMYKGGGGLNNPNVERLGEHGVSTPIHGTEVDWYYERGAFAIVCEFGTHQRVPSRADTETEFAKTFAAFLMFVKKAPMVKLSTKSQ